MRRVLALFTTLAALAAQAPQAPVDERLAQARGLQADGKLTEALAAVQRALERDDRSLPALRLLADLALALNERDLAAHALHRWNDVVGAARGTAVPAAERKAVAESLAALDPEARTWDQLQKRYVEQLMKLGADYRRRKDWIAAIEVYAHVLEVDAEHGPARTAIREIRRSGGREVAVEDLFAGADPSLGKTQEQIAREDAQHADWERAWEKDTENYGYRTDAGFLVLETSAIAMEQMNGFYRRFFRYKLDGGKTPKIEIRIFKDRDEYLKLGSNPVEWSGGQFTGDAVETYAGGVSGNASIRDMYGTLFHEAAHQFVSLTGPGVPGWLNEAYASFFEGCVILSSGAVEWNKVPPGRLFPLAQRLERGWMSGPDDGVRVTGSEWSEPERAPTFRMVVEGDYRWGPPWYAPTWGVVYFLYNCRTADGRLVYRDALHAYYESFQRGQSPDPAAHFEEVVLRGAPLSSVPDLAALDAVWRDWILHLRDVYTGKIEQGDQLVAFGDAALGRGDEPLALQFYEEALAERGGDLEVLTKCARLLEQVGRKPQAAARWRQLKRELELRGATGDGRHAEAGRKVAQLDPLQGRYVAIKQALAQAGLALARGYDGRGLPTMALEIARRMSASFSIPEALELYVEIARRTAKSLARWRLAYDERSLRGWSGGDGAYQAYGDQIRADVTAGAPSDTGLFTRQLTCDVTFDADFSLEAAMRIEAYGQDAYTGSLMGLCFGRKGDLDFHAVVLHPKGFLDIATNRGGVWEILDHRQTKVGGDWHTMRIDVTDRTLDVYLDGFYVRSLEFKSRETLSGGFGLITGAGSAIYKDIRVLARDRFDPAAALERTLAMERIHADSTLRQAGSFAGLAPPALQVGEWVQGDAVALDQLAGRPLLLAFWSPAQDQVIPTAALLAHLAERGREQGLAVVVVCDGGTKADELRGYLRDHPLPGASVGIDGAGNGTYEAFWIKAGHHGIPRLLLIDRKGIVQFEGDPGVSAGAGWQPGEPTYVDDALAKLLE